jgi:Flp pilus assembly pilin Flp
MSPRPLVDGPAFQRPEPMLIKLEMLFAQRRSLGGTNVKQHLVRLWREEEGQDLTEYALLLVLLSLAAVGSLSALATAINNVFSQAVVNLT